jgi:hypothetical protein
MIQRIVEIVGQSQEWIAAVVAVATTLWGLYQKIKVVGDWKKTLRSVISGVDVALGDSGLPEKVPQAVRAVIKEVTNQAGTAEKVRAEVDQLRLERAAKAAAAKNKHLDFGVTLDEKGRPQGGINFKLDF